MRSPKIPVFGCLCLQRRKEVAKDGVVVPGERANDKGLQGVEAGQKNRCRDDGRWRARESQRMTR